MASTLDMISAMTAMQSMSGIIDVGPDQLLLGITNHWIGTSCEDQPVANLDLTGLQHINDQGTFTLRAVVAVSTDSTMNRVQDANAAHNLQNKATTIIMEARVASASSVTYIASVLRARTHLGITRPVTGQPAPRGWGLRIPGVSTILQPLPPPTVATQGATAPRPTGGPATGRTQGGRGRGGEDYRLPPTQPFRGSGGRGLPPPSSTVAGDNDPSGGANATQEGAAQRDLGGSSGAQRAGARTQTHSPALNPGAERVARRRRHGGSGGGRGLNLSFTSKMDSISAEDHNP
ncbi:hypothetical protein V8C86DRAFT_2978784, partial [Haematococcus lacustris]